MNGETLAPIIRRRARVIIDSYNGAGVDFALRDDAEMLLALARLCEGKSLHQAFGAPGDWGYETEMGQALQAIYSVKDGQSR